MTDQELIAKAWELQEQKQRQQESAMYHMRANRLNTLIEELKARGYRVTESVNRCLVINGIQLVTLADCANVPPII